METLLKGLGVAIGTIVLVGFVALFAGSLVYWLWPVAIPAAFPGLVDKGIIAGQIMWWPSVCLTWLCGILIKSTITNNNSK